MGKLFYSSSTNGFYNSTIHKTKPNDCIEITHNEYYEIMSQVGAIVADENGRPKLLSLEYLMESN